MAHRHRYHNSPALTVSEAARLLCIHVNTVRKWSDLGILRSHRIGPRGDRRFREEDITAFLWKAESAVTRRNQ